MREPRDTPQDFGIGAAAAQASRRRLLERSGRFNVGRVGLGFFESWSAYHWLLELTWPRFLLAVAGAFLAANTVFATGYYLLGPGTLAVPGDDPLRHDFLQAFFFSVETLATIGYGHISPRGLGANIILTIETMAGLLGLAIVTGLVFARFARPAAAIRFSDLAVIAPYRGGRGFMFRVANTRRSELFEVQARVSVSLLKGEGGTREFHELSLERDEVVFFPMSWTIVHPIGPDSPLAGLDQQALAARDAEFLVYLKAFDDAFSQTVHARASYKPPEVICDARFVSIIDRDGADGIVRVDVRRLSEIERI